MLRSRDYPDHQRDQFGDLADPYCGSGSAISVFRQYLGDLATVPSWPPLDSYLRNGTCCGPDEAFSTYRDAAQHDWCHVRNVASGLSIATLVVLFIASLVASWNRYRDRILISASILALIGGKLVWFWPVRRPHSHWHLKPKHFLICLSSPPKKFTAAFGVACTVVFLSWYRPMQKDFDASPIFKELSAGSSLPLFIIGWLLAFFAAAGEIFAACSTKYEAPLPPLDPRFDTGIPLETGVTNPAFVRSTISR